MTFGRIDSPLFLKAVGQDPTGLRLVQRATCIWAETRDWTELMPKLM